MAGLFACIEILSCKYSDYGIHGCSGIGSSCDYLLGCLSGFQEGKFRQSNIG